MIVADSLQHSMCIAFALSSELSSLASCKREHLVRECAIAKYHIPECGADGDLDFSIAISAIVHDPPRCCTRLAALARFLWIDDGFAISLCFDVEWAETLQDLQPRFLGRAKSLLALSQLCHPTLVEPLDDEEDCSNNDHKN